MGIKILHGLIVSWLMVCIGLHLPVLQVAAWGGMWVEFVRSGDPAGVALGKTLDGQHACKICRWIGSRAGEPRDPAPAPGQSPSILKFDLISPPAGMAAPGCLTDTGPEYAGASSLSPRKDPPPVPPPRLLCA